MDEVEQATVRALKCLEDEFSYAMQQGSRYDGHAKREIQEGYGNAVSKILDAVTRLRKQKEGGS